MTAVCSLRFFISSSVPFRPSLRLLKRHSRRVVVVVLCLQVTYILINITERSGYNKTFLSHLPSEMYTFRRRFKDERIREPLGRKVLRSPENILYEECKILNIVMPLMFDIHLHCCHLIIMDIFYINMRYTSVSW